MQTQIRWYSVKINRRWINVGWSHVSVQWIPLDHWRGCCSAVMNAQIDKTWSITQTEANSAYSRWFPIPGASFPACPESEYRQLARHVIQNSVGWSPLHVPAQIVLALPNWVRRTLTEFASYLGGAWAASKCLPNHIVHNFFRFNRSNNRQNGKYSYL